MAFTERSVVVGVFESRENARDAVAELRDAGFSEEQVGLITRRTDEDSESAYDTTAGYDVEDEARDTKAGEGAVAGLIAGAGAGGLWAVGIAAGLLPAIGPVIAGGVLASILASAAAGAAAGGLVGALIGMGIPEDEAEYYESEFRAGRTLVTVRADGRYEDARAILRRHGAIEDRSAETMAGTTTAPDLTRDELHGTEAEGIYDRDTEPAGRTMDTAMPLTGNYAAGELPERDVDAEGERTIPLREEEVVAKKRERKAGEVDIHKDVVTEHKTLNVPVEREEVVIERRPVDRDRTAAGFEAGEMKEEDIRIPIREEEVSVEKRPVVKEEVRVGKREVRENRNVSADAKREELHVEERGDVRSRAEDVNRR